MRFQFFPPRVIQNRHTRVSLVFSILLICLTSCACRRNDRIPNTTSNSDSSMTFSDEVVARHNKGVALMGHFDYSAAYDIFEKLAVDFPNWKGVQVDLAIATLNRREPGDSDRALKLLKNVTNVDPTNLRAVYCQGILALDSGDPELALKLFSHVASEDPQDAYAVYYTGQCMSQLSDIDGALHKFLKVIELDPYFRSAYYGVFQGLLRQGKMQEANDYREDFERLADNPAGTLGRD